MTDLLYQAQPFVEGLMGICSALYVAGVIWFVAGMRKREGKNRQTPFVSVVVAARDEVERIRECLGGLVAQDYPNFEVVVVDDGSTDGTAKIVGEIAAENRLVRLLSTQEVYGRSGSKKAALGLGIDACGGEIVLTTDADCLVPPTWVRGMVEFFDGETGMVVGFSQIGTPASVRGARMGYEAVDFLCLMSCIMGSAGQGRAMAASGQNLAFRKSAFLQVGGYERVMHRASGDDVLLLQMVKRLTGWRITFSTSPETFVIHPPASSWWDLFQKRLRWASNAPCQLRWDPLFFSYMVVTFIMDLLLVLSPWLVLAGGLGMVWAAGSWGVKMLAELVLFRRGVDFSSRRDLLRFFPLWTLLQPMHVVAVGALGCLGIFSWKGKRHRWGRQR